MILKDFENNRQLDGYFYFVYKTENILNSDYYIGIHKTKNINDSYLGSGIIINKSIKKYGKENFIRKILYFGIDYNDIYDKERELVTEETLKDIKCLNLTIGGLKGSFFRINERVKIDPEYKKFIKEKIRLSKTQKVLDKQAESLKKYFSNIENRKHLSEVHKNRYLNIDNRKEISNKTKIKMQTSEMREKMSKLFKDKMKLKNGDIVKYFNKSDIEIYLQQGWNFLSQRQELKYRKLNNIINLK